MLYVFFVYNVVVKLRVLVESIVRRIFGHVSEVAHSCCSNKILQGMGLFSMQVLAQFLLVTVVGKSCLAAAPYIKKTVSVIASGCANRSVQKIIGVTAILFTGCLLKKGIPLLAKKLKEKRGYAVWGAAKSGDRNRVQKLLKQGSISEIYQILAIEDAIADGHEEIVRVLLSSRHIEHWRRNGLVLLAVQKSKINIIELLVEDGSINEECRQEAYKAAIKCKQWSIVKYLLERGYSMDEGNQKCAFRDAAAVGQKDIIQLLLEKIPISTGMLDDPFSCAVKGVHVAVIEQLLVYQELISEVWLKDALKQAAFSGNNELLKLLLAKDNVIFKNVINDATYNAAKNGYQDTVDLLLKSGGALTYAISGAAESGCEDVVKWLLENDRITENCLNYAVENATKAGHDDIVKLLLARYPASEKIWKGALECAAKHGRENIAKILFGSREVTQDCRIRVAVEAARAGHEGIVGLCLKNGLTLGLKDVLLVAAQNGHVTIIRLILSVSQNLATHDIGEALFDSKISNNKDVIEALLNLDPLSFSNLPYVEQDRLPAEIARFVLQNDFLTEWCRSWAIVLAAKAGEEQMVEQLLAKRPDRINIKARNWAVKTAAEKGYENIVRQLLSNGDIDLAYRDWALRLAASVGHEGIVRLLVGDGCSDYRNRAIAIVAQNGHPAIIRILLRECDGNFIEADINHVLLRAASDGRRDVVEALLANVPSISSILRESAITNAGGEHQEAIRDMLRVVAVNDDPGSGRREIRAGEQVNLAEIQANPCKLLQKIALNQMPPCFYLEESPQAIDLGGITKQVVTTLVDALIDQKFLKTDSILRLPTSEGEDSVAMLKRFGQFLCKLDHHNQLRTDKFLIGARWSPELFALLQPKEGASTTDILVRLIKEKEDPNFDVYATLLRDAANPEALETYVKYGGFDSPEEAKEAFLQWRGSIETAVNALRSELTPAFKEKLRKMSAKEFSDQIQGVEASADTIIAAFKLEVPADDKVERFQQRVKWLKEWIHSADEGKRKAFLMAITGRDVLGKETQIAIRWSWRSAGVVELHTCFNSFDLPNIDELTKDDFFAMVTGISGGKTGYNIA